MQAALTGAAGVERAERLRVLGSRLRILDRILEAEQALNESIRLASDAGDAVGAARAGSVWRSWRFADAATT